jgi:acyl carrier protein
MTNLEKYNDVFVKTFEIEENILGESLIYQSITQWDSVGHMALMAGLEEVFEIMMDTDDIIDFSGYEKGKEIIGKYDVKI